MTACSASGPDTASSPTTTHAQPTNTAEPAATSEALARALAVLDEQDYITEDASIYDENARFTVLIGIPKTCGAGCPTLAFFFADGTFVGNDSSTPSGSMGVKSQDGGTIVLTYGIYQPGDPACCPSGEDVNVRFTWDGSNLIGGDSVPSEKLREPIPDG